MMTKIFQLVLLLGLSSGLWMGADGKCTRKGGCCEACPNGWSEIDERCYLYRGKAKIWCEAETQCNKEGGNLASFHNEKELEVLHHFVEDVGKGVGVWVGGYDAVREGSWKFSDGSKNAFKAWAAELRNDPDIEDCMELKKGKVVDSQCDVKKPYVCSTHLRVQH
ncbi:galactose-specific lectin nattectin-like [Halichoeres trimaculatus]|uniref:galactose-specific lectin nattectin-like n=1 Tax=Halichoeres trimaculatus TaxID=147232 RepID=UPI003D9EF069